MSTIDKIMGAIGRHGDDCILDGDAASVSFEALRAMIAAALADARREGAEAMQSECAKLARRVPLYDGGSEPADEELAQTIEDLPMPTGERQAVLLTDEQIAMALHVWAGNEPAEFDFGNWRNDSDSMNLIELWRYVEAAAIAANGLDSAR